MAKVRHGSRQITEAYVQKLKAVQVQALLSEFRLCRLPLAPEDAEPKKRCNKCGELWPASAEFFFRTADGIFRSPCRACIDEKRAETAAVTPCAFPGCNEPRYHWRSSYCYDHRYHRSGRKVAS